MSRNGMHFWQKWKRPRGFWLVLLYVVTLCACAGAISLVFLKNLPKWVEFLTYFSYGLAAVCFGYSVYTLVIYAPRIKRRVIAVMRKNQWIARMLDNYGFRTVVTACVSLLLNVSFAVFNGVVALMARSVWYGALATYYILLTVLRSRLVLHHRKLAKGGLEDETAQRCSEIARYRMCGVLLITMPLCLSAAIVQMIVSDKGYAYGGLTIYVVAAYTFYKIIAAIVNAVKAKENDDMTIKALRNVGVADGAVSVLALQTAMFYSFGGGMNTDLANALVGAGVCALTLGMGVYMLVRAGKEAKEVRHKDGREQ